MRDGFEVGVMILTMIMCAIGGWVFAHNTVASECEKLGGFYVGGLTYTCQKVQK